MKNYIQKNSAGIISGFPRQRKKRKKFEADAASATRTFFSKRIFIQMSVTGYIIFTALSLMVLHYLIQLLVWLGLTINEYHDQPAVVQPKVSVLLAVRNEEDNITECVEALSKLDYPTNKIEILIGNDQSTDGTVGLIEPLLKKYHQFQLHHITEQLGKARGKANVLANLAHVATGEYFFITDADIQVNPNWIQSMLVRFDDETAIVSGITIGKGNNFFEKLQALDWTYFNAVLTATTNMGIPCTAVGNNMVISRNAYFATGGYEALDFSVTEDYKLYAAVRKLKWKTKNIATPGSFHFTKTLPDFKSVLHQRKRWLTGGKELPLYWWLMLFVFGLFYPAILFLLFTQPTLAIKCWLLKFIFEAAIINRQLLRLQQPSAFLLLIAHQFYSMVLSLCVAVFYYLPFKFAWKNRYY